jgi:alkylation response protein AidB-like acyl-CoA dehydrogenase
MTSDVAEGTLEIVHRIPGRLRLRVPPGVSGTELRDAIAALPGVTSAAWSPLTRGLLVLYDRERAEEPAIVAEIADHAELDVAVPVDPTTNGKRPTLAATVTSLFGAIDTRVTGATGGALALGVVVPAVLTLWAARELLRGRAAPLAWSSALWYAHGLFRDYALPTRED